MKALELLKECKELLVDVTIEKNGETAKTGILWIEKFDEAIAELQEAMKPKTCDWCNSFELDTEFNDGYGKCFFGIHFPNSKSSSYHNGCENSCNHFNQKVTHELHNNS